MNLIISFSARKNGNCDYECFQDYCKYHGDEIYEIYSSFCDYEKVFLVVPMYCGNPSSLYFVFNERCQDFFMHNENTYEDIISRLYIIGVYGSKEETPDFIPCLEKWFNCTNYKNHVFGIERHKYNQKMKDAILEIDEVKDDIIEFINKGILQKEYI